MRLIVDYDSELITPGDALRRVARVIDDGRVSQTSLGVLHFCWCTIWPDNVAVITRTKKKNQKSDSFRVEHK